MTPKPPRRRAILIVVAIAAVAAVIAIATLSRGQSTQMFRGNRALPGQSLPPFTLRDSTGEVIRASDLRGKVLIVTFLDTHCTAACPIIASQVGRALVLLTPPQRQDVRAIAFSVDPDGDTPASIRTFLRHHRVEGRLHYLVGTLQQMRPVWRSFKVLPSAQTHQHELHSAPVRLYNRSGVWVATQHVGADLTPENLAHDLRLVLNDAT